MPVVNIVERAAEAAADQAAQLPVMDLGPAPISMELAQFLALWLESVLYGTFLILFIGTIWVVVWHRSGERVNRIMLGTAILLFLVATAHMIVSVLRAVDAFVTNSGAVLPYFLRIQHPYHVAQIALYGMAAIAADTLLIWRIYVVWGRNIWITIGPGCLVLTGAVLGYIGCGKLANLHDGDTLFVMEINNYITLYFVFTIVTNVVCTTLLAFRIWSTHRAVSGLASTPVSRLAPIVLESGALYSAVLVIQLVVYGLHSNATVTVFDPSTPLIGIVFCMIIVRVSLALHSRSGTTFGAVSSGTAVCQTGSTMPMFNGHRGNVPSQHFGSGFPAPPDQFRLKSVSVRVDQTVMSQTDAKEEGSDGDRSSVRGYVGGY